MDSHSRTCVVMFPHDAQTHTHTKTHTFICTHAHFHAPKHANALTRTHLHTHARARAFIHVLQVAHKPVSTPKLALTYLSGGTCFLDVFPRVSVYFSLCVCLCVCVCLSAFSTHAYIHKYMCTSMCVCVCMNVCVHDALLSLCFTLHSLPSLLSLSSWFTVSECAVCWKVCLSM